VSHDGDIVFDDVSKFYGEVLGVNRVSLRVGPGITSLVGPNGSGKTTLMNLTLGLLRPSQGTISVLGTAPTEVESFFRLVGYCSHYDSFPRGMSGRRFVLSSLLLHGVPRREAEPRAEEALTRVGLQAAADRPVAGYSKGMRQRVKLAQAMVHDPRVLILDEPLSGLDPMARAEVIALLQTLAADGKHVVISSHILHEVDMLSDRVVLLNGGYVVAEGAIQGVREEMSEHPLQILVRCDRASYLASRIFAEDHALEIKLHEDRGGLLVRTTDPGGFYRLLRGVVVGEGLEIEALGPADDDVHAVYRYLIGNDGEAR
jgi:ABC-2 type transport system ATP-binding protein